MTSRSADVAGVLMDSHDVRGLGIAVSGDVKDLGVGVTKNISTMAWPLALGAAVIGGVMLMKK